MKLKKVRLATYVSPSLAAAARREAAKWDVSTAAILRQALALYLAQAEELARRTAGPLGPATKEVEEKEEK